MAANGPFILRFDNTDNDHYFVTIEVNNRVAYGYLWYNSEIISSVWLYNRMPLTDTKEWRSRDNLPFLNCIGYASSQGVIDAKIVESDFNVDWDCSDSDVIIAYIYLYEDLIGMIASDSKVGYARYAIVNSPIAKVMEYA